MTREEIISQYAINEHGIIISPGKFEGEMLYVPFYWNIGLEGFANIDDGDIYGFNIEAADRELFPELARVKTLALRETDQGFVLAETHSY